MKEIGEQFKEKREEIGITIEEVSNDLSRDVIVIENLENGNHKVFRDILDLKDMFRIYARYLGLDDEKILTEYQLQRKAEKYFKENKYNFVFCSSTNIDRIAAIHKAAINTNKMFICDEYQKDILEYINSVSRSNLYKFNDEKNIKKTKVYYYDKNLLDTMKKRGFVMLVRANKLSRYVLKMFPQNNFIYSQWLGYLDKDSKGYKEIQEFVPEEHVYLHTSGHATPKAIKDVIDITKPKSVIPIHTEAKNKIIELTKNAVILNDEEEFIVE